MFDNSDPDAEIEARAGRKFPYSTCGDWVGLADPALVPPQSKLLYWLLRMHCNTERADNRAWPTQATLALMLGLKKPTDIGKYTKPLVAIEAVEVETVRWGKNRMYKRLIYTTHEAPPPGYEGAASLKDWYAEVKRRAIEEHSKGQVKPDIPPKGGPKGDKEGQARPDIPSEGGPDVPSKGCPDLPSEGGRVLPQKGHKQTEPGNKPKNNNPNPGGPTAAPQTPAVSEPVVDVRSGLITELEPSGPLTLGLGDGSDPPDLGEDLDAEVMRQYLAEYDQMDAVPNGHGRTRARGARQRVGG